MYFSFEIRLIGHPQKTHTIMKKRKVNNILKKVLLKEDNMKNKMVPINGLLIMCMVVITVFFSRNTMSLDASTVISVSNENELRNAINASVTDELTEISLSSDFSVETAIEIPTGKNILITNEAPHTISVSNGNTTIFRLGIGSILTIGNGGPRVTLVGNPDDVSTSLIYCQNDSVLTVNNATIKNSKSGAIGMNQSYKGILITVNDGAIIEGNHKIQGGGGAIYASNSIVVVNGGIFRDNRAVYMGGAILVVGDLVGYLVVNGGTFTDNHIYKGTGSPWGGGAIAIGTRTEESYIRGGIFENNTATSMGGAIYVDNGGYLTMTNAVITRNVAPSFGGGIWYCEAGGGLYFDDYGLLNTGNTSARGTDLFLNIAVTKPVTLTNNAFGGITISWFSETTGQTLTNLTLTRSSPLGYRADVVGNYDIEKVISEAKVVIQNNESSTVGGGLACNGSCTFGVETPISKTVTKEWKGTGAPSYKVKVQLYKNGIPFDMPVELSSANSWTYTWPDLIDDGSDYTVKEVSINDVSINGDNLSIDDGNYEGTVVIVVTDDGQTSDFYITNTFSRTAATKGKAKFEGTKTYTNGTLSGEDFEFGLYKADSSGTKTNQTAIETVKNTQNGSITFTEIEYAETEVGTYYYVMEEIAGTSNKITYSGLKVLVKVIVELSSDGTKVVTTVTYDGLDTKPVFENEYTAATKGKAKFEGTKTYTNGTLNGEDFEFGLYKADSSGTKTNQTAIETVKNTQNGSITFTEIEYAETEVGTYYYVMEEIAGTSNKITYSGLKVLVKVVVELSSDGTKVVTTVTYDGLDTKPVFENEYHDISISTSAWDKVSWTKSAEANISVTIVDIVTYENLVVGKEYRIEGTLMSKLTGQQLLIGGSPVTATHIFTPTSANGTETLEFVFNGTGLGGTSVVVFEELYDSGGLVATHTNINDLDQTVNFRKKPPKTGVRDNIVSWSLMNGIALLVILKSRKKNENY